MSKIALIGVSGAGKDFITSTLVKHVENTHRVSFSDQLKKKFKEVFSWAPEDFAPFEKERSHLITVPHTNETVNLIPREAWIAFSGCVRGIENNIWIRMLSEEVESIQRWKSNGQEPNIIVSDLRSMNEYIWCKANGYTIVRVEPSKQVYEPNEYDEQQKSIPHHKIFVNEFHDDIKDSETAIIDYFTNEGLI